MVMCMHTQTLRAPLGDEGLLLLRGVVGPLMVAHGLGKVNGFGGAGYGITGTAGFLEGLGFRPGKPYAWLTAATEIGAGAGVTAGLGTPLAAAGLIGVMATAARTGHRGQGPWVFNNGWEHVAVLGATGAALAFTGPGRYSLDRALGTERVGPIWGAAALALGLGSAVTALTTRRPPAPVPMPTDPAAAATSEGNGPSPATP